MASKKSRRRRSNPEVKKSPLEKKEVKIGIFILAIILIVAIAAVILMSGGNNNDGNGDIVEGNPIAVIDTSKGIIKVELFQDLLPTTVENFINLANDDYYDGMIFHRVMDDFMIQAGNMYPDGPTSNNPGTIEYEEHENATHVDGAISMASTGDRVGGSAQFFICDGARHDLDGRYAAFGVTIEGIEVVRDIADEPHDGSSGSVGGGKPYTDIIINSITIENQ